MEDRLLHVPADAGAVVSSVRPAVKRAEGLGMAEARPDRGDWWFLGVRVKELTSPGAEVVVAEATLPKGASPPLHLHENLDDSFYLIEGTMVVRCGDDVSLATPGTWVPFPRGVPHTFRVMDRPARVLLVHANDSFMRAVQGIGRLAADDDVPTAADGPSPEQLTRAMAAHDIRAVGPPMEEDEARSWLGSLASP
jgi:mannose-6-phosphate isomerase-like protein (cupin superfamily)